MALQDMSAQAPAVSSLNRVLLHPAAKPALWLICALPMASLVVKAVLDRLGANPAEALVHETGEWALRWLWATLAITPLRQIFQMPALLKFRRALGVSAFVYALLHFVAYAWLDKGLVIDDIVKDVFKRNFILVGLATLVLMTPLALTSFNSAIRALGGKRWQMLHKLVYVVAIGALLHFLWKKSGKNDYAEVGVYALILAGLLGWRFGRWSRQIH
jgi:methionine sulfoxide reductase heme-binding subunit